MRLLYLMLAVMMRALLPRPEPKRQRPSSPPERGQTAEGGGVRWKTKDPPLRDSANHRLMTFKRQPLIDSGPEVSLLYYGIIHYILLL